MHTSELRIYLDRLSDELLESSAEIIAETATTYFRESFSRKGFDGQAWAPSRHAKRTGSLLVASGTMMNSIMPAVVTRQRVVITAGNDKVGYAQAHNEGFQGVYNVPAHTRRRGRQEVAVRAHMRHGTLPQRRFIGRAKELDRAITERINAYIQHIK